MSWVGGTIAAGYGAGTSTGAVTAPGNGQAINAVAVKSVNGHASIDASKSIHFFSDMF